MIADEVDMAEVNGATVPDDGCWRAEMPASRSILNVHTPDALRAM